MVGHNICQRILSLFKGNGCHVVYSIEGKKVAYTTVPVQPSVEAVRDHLMGTKGLGIVPINSDNRCYFAALDVDDFKEASLVQSSLPIPFHVYPSKSKGVHAYLFFSESLAAGDVRTFLLSMCSLLDLSKTEAFPKQNELLPGKNGSSINLPLYGYLKTNTEADLDLIVQGMEDSKLSSVEWSVFKVKWLYGAPSCLRRGFLEPIGVGFRNEALYKLAVFFNISLRDLVDVKDILFSAKNVIKWQGWGEEEEHQCLFTIRSGLQNFVGKNCSGCRCFGKIQDERPVEMTGMFDLIEESESIVLYKSEEPLYIVRLKNGQMIKLTVDQLSSPMKLVNAVLGQINAVVRAPGNNNRLAWLVRFTNKAVIEELPNDADLHRMVMENLKTYLKATSSNSNSPLSRCFALFDTTENKHYFSFTPFHKYVVDSGCDITPSMLYYILIENDAKRSVRATVSGTQDLISIDKIVELREDPSGQEDII